MSLEDLEQRAEEALSRPDLGETPDVDIPDPKSVTYRDYENPFALVRDTSGCPNISALSPYAWCGVGDDIYVLECLGKGFLRIQPFVDDAPEDATRDKPAFVATYAPANKWGGDSPYLTLRRVLTAATLADAVRGADNYAAAKACPGNMAAGCVAVLLVNA